jgi:hypothetical protein
VLVLRLPRDALARLAGGGFFELGVIYSSRGGDDARHSQGLTKVPRHMPRLAFLASFSASTWSFEYRRYARAHPAETNLRLMSTPSDGENLGDQAAVPIPLDHLAAHLDPGREGLERGQGHRAAHEFLALPPETSGPVRCRAT